MILDHALVAAGDEDEMLDAGVAGLVDHVLDQRPVDHGQHLFRHGLGGRQEAGAEPRNGKHGLADASRHPVLVRLNDQQGKANPSQGLEVPQPLCDS